MARKIKDNPLKKAILKGVEQLIDIAEISKGVEMTITINKDSVPTVSYKVDELLIIAEDEWNESTNTAQNV